MSVDCIDKDGNYVRIPLKFSSSQSISSLRSLSVDDQSPIKWCAFCKSSTFGYDAPRNLYSFDYEADDGERVGKYFSSNDHISGHYIFVGWYDDSGKGSENLFTIPVCPRSTYSQLRDRIGNMLGTRDFSFVISDLQTQGDEEKTTVRQYVRVTSLKGLFPGANLLAQYERSLEDIRARTVFIRKGPPIKSEVEKEAGFVTRMWRKIKAKVTGKAEKEGAAQKKPEKPVNVVLTLQDESVGFLPNIDINNTTVLQLREHIKKYLEGKNVKENWHQTLAICSPYTSAELREDDILANHMIVTSGDAVIFNVQFVPLVDWLSGKETPTVVTACPRSTYKQLIMRAAPSFPKIQSVLQYAVHGHDMLVSAIPPRYLHSGRKEAEDSKNPLHIRYADSIFVDIQDGEGHRRVMIQDTKHRYLVGLVYQRLEELLGKENGWCRAVCAPMHNKQVEAIELPPTSSLVDYDLAHEGVRLDAMVIRVKVTLENANETRDLLMNVCPKSTISDLEIRLRMAVGASEDDQVFFFHKRGASVAWDKQDITLSMFRTRPPEYPWKTLYAWVGRQPFFQSDRTKYTDGHLTHRNIFVTLPDETLVLLNNVHSDTNVAGLREVLKDRVMKGTALKEKQYETMAICDEYDHPMQNGKKIWDYLGKGDNRLKMHWVTAKFLHLSDQPKQYTVCAGESYKQFVERVLQTSDPSQYEVMDGSWLDAKIGSNYIADVSGLYAGDTLIIKHKDERVISVRSPDTADVLVTVPKEASKISDVRAELIKKLGAAHGWGLALCRKPGIDYLWEDKRELPEDMQLKGSAGKVMKLAYHHALIVMLSFGGKVQRIPATVCSADLKELQDRMRRAVGAAPDDAIVTVDDGRSPLQRLLPHSGKTTVIHMEISIKGKAPGASSKPKDKPDKDSGKEPSSKEVKDRLEAAPLWVSSSRANARNLGLALTIAIVIALMAYVAFSPGEHEEVEVAGVAEPIESGKTAPTEHAEFGWPEEQSKQS